MALKLEANAIQADILSTSATSKLLMQGALLALEALISAQSRQIAEQKELLALQAEQLQRRGPGLLRDGFVSAKDCAQIDSRGSALEEKLKYSHETIANLSVRLSESVEERARLAGAHGGCLPLWRLGERPEVQLAIEVISGIWLSVTRSCEGWLMDMYRVFGRRRHSHNVFGESGTELMR